ncbi:MAG: hypothetical protein ACYDC2_06480, partial [Solirubrobacteraceae bacterium]
EPAREGALGARGILVGSRHTAMSLWETLQEPPVHERTRLGPPGVDVERFAPRERGEAEAALGALAARLSAEPKVPVSAEGAGVPAAEKDASAFQRDTGAAGQALARLDPGQDRLVAFVGKLIVSKGIDLLVACWPLVLAQVPRARLVVIGFGAYRAGTERLIGALAAGDLAAAEAVARAGRALERQDTPAGEQARPLRHLLAFLESLEGERRECYVRDAARLEERVVLTGRLEHEELADVLPAC